MRELAALSDIAIDFDDTCIHSFREFVAYFQARGCPHTLEQYVAAGHHYDALWGLSKEQTHQRFSEFHTYFCNLALPIPGAYEVLQKLRATGKILHMLTFRDQELEDVTMQTVTRLFPETFHQIDVCGWSEQGTIPPVRKAETCLKRGIQVIVEDNISTALECAEQGIFTLLIDMPWNHTVKTLPEKIIRVRDWLEIETLLLPT